MRKTTKALFAILVVSCLALSSLMASPNTWAWLQSSLSSEVSEEPAVTLPEEPAKSTKESKVSKATSKTPEYVQIPYDEYVEYVAMIKEGNAYNKKGGEQVNDAVDGLSSIVKPVKEPLFKSFITLDAERNIMEKDIDLGVSIGFIFKDCLMFSTGVKKTGLNDWMNKETYTLKASVGIVF